MLILMLIRNFEFAEVSEAHMCPTNTESKYIDKLLLLSVQGREEQVRTQGQKESCVLAEDNYSLLLGILKMFH